MLVRMENIRKTYNEKTYVLDGLNFSLDNGQIAIIRGASGCGKSTFLNILGLLDAASGGDYFFQGKKVNPRRLNSFQNELADDIGFVFQSYYLLDSLTVYDNIMLPFLYNSRRIDSTAIENLLQLANELGIAPLLYKKAKFLSGGERQRVAICRAMIKKPKIVIADEPTGNLDASNTELAVAAMQKAVDYGAALVIVTHDTHLDMKDATHYHLEGGALHHD